VRANELPDGWGLIAPHGDGFRVKVRPAKLDPAPMPREFLAALLRSAASAATSEAIVEEARREWYKRGYERSEARTRTAADELSARRLKELEAAVAQIESVAGLLGEWNAGDVARAMALYRQRRDRAFAENRANVLADQLRDLAAQVERAMAHARDGEA
jgi:hypothetical protein